MPTGQQPTDSSWSPLIRPAEQVTLAAIVVASFAAMLGWLAWQQWAAGRLIEIDEAPRERISYLVDINRADWVELSTLPELGVTLARRVVENREEFGPFADHDDLRRVRGIGPKTLERIKPYLLPMPPRGTIVTK